MKNKIHSRVLIIGAALLLSASSAFSTGLSFQTLNPTVGDILTSGSEPITSGQLQFGTLTGNLNFTDTGAFTQYSDFSSIFTPAGSASFQGTGNVAGSVATGTLAGGVNLWALADIGGEQAAFYLGVTPALNTLVATPASSSVAWGSRSGDNILLAAVPEPSAYGLLAGMLALSWVMVRRRA